MKKFFQDIKDGIVAMFKGKADDENLFTIGMIMKRIKRQIITHARGSIIANPRRAPKIPMNEPTEESASERWCQASAINAEEFIFFA